MAGGHGRQRRFDEFKNRGYVVLPNAIPVEECDAIVQAIKQKKRGWRPIHRDSNRSQIRVDDMEEMKPVEQRIRKKVQNAFKGFCECEWEINQWVGIKSLAGGANQTLHTDWTEAEWNEVMGSTDSRTERRRKRNGTESRTIPASILVIVDENSVLRVVPKTSFDFEPAKVKDIHFEKGQLCIFRGDLVHGGIGYNDINVRIHAFLDPKDSAGMRSTNATHYAKILTFPCRECGRPFKSKAYRVYHERYCGSSEEKVQNRKRKNAQNKKYKDKKKLCC